MARREIKTIRVSEIPPLVRDAYELRSSYTIIPKEIQTVINTHMKGSAGFRDFSSLRAADSEGFQEVRRWGRLDTTSRPLPRSTGSLAATPTGVAAKGTALSATRWGSGMGPESPDPRRGSVDPKPPSPRRVAPPGITSTI